MNKGIIVSYFDKVQKKKYISSSISQLALKLNIHRNTLSNWLKRGYYEDETRLVFSISSKEFICRLRKKEAPMNSIERYNNQNIDMQYKRHIAQSKSISISNQSLEAFIQAGED